MGVLAQNTLCWFVHQNGSFNHYNLIMKTITLSRNGANRTIPTGFSWTTLFFGPIPSMIRCHWSFAIKVFACDAISMAFAAFIFGIDWWPVTWMVFRIAISMIRNNVLRLSFVSDGWSKEPMQKGIELRGNVVDAANDEEDYNE